MRPVISSTKHYVHFPVATITNGARSNFQISNATAKGAVRVAADEVSEGSLVKAFYLEIWGASATSLLTISSAVYKRPFGAGNMTFTDMTNVGSYSNKKDVLEFHQGIAPSNGNVVPLYRHWIKVPKGKQRQGLTDKLMLTIAAIGADMVMCGFATYKEYS